MNTADSTRFCPKSVVINPFVDWRTDHRSRKPEHETVIYGAHVKGFTMQRGPAVAPGIRGTYAALGHPDLVEHLVSLGISVTGLLHDPSSAAGIFVA